MELVGYITYNPTKTYMRIGVKLQRFLKLDGAGD
jgi:hypothetical protein